MSDGPKKTYWYASGGRRIAQPINWQGWTLFAVWLIAMIGGSQWILANGARPLGPIPSVALAVSWAVLTIAVYYLAVTKLTDKSRTPESYWEEQERKK